MAHSSEALVIEEHLIHHRGDSGEECNQRRSFAQRSLIVMATDRCGKGRLTIDMLPDDALLRIFSCIGESTPSRILSWWIPLVHTCGRWRYIIFGSPLHLHLALVCLPKMPVRKSLEIWPPFPIIVHHDDSSSGDENTIAALEHRNRVSEIYCHLIVAEIKKFATVLQEPFPALTNLTLSSNGNEDQLLPGVLLGGSAPSLRMFELERLAFPALPTLLLSAPNLVSLMLYEIQESGYISPEAMATCLATLAHLERLHIDFYPPLSFDPEPTSPPSFPRGVLPTLTYFSFKGAAGYLDDLVSRIDTPILQTFSTTFLFFTVPHIPQFIQFVSRVEEFTGKSLTRAVLEFDDFGVEFKLKTLDRFELGTRFDYLSERVGPMMNLVCRELSPLFSCVDSLDLCGDTSRCGIPGPVWWSRMLPAQWLDFFHPFIATQTLRVSCELFLCVVYALRDLTNEEATEMLPELRTLFLEGFARSKPVPPILDQFVSVRQLSGRPSLDCQSWDIPGRHGSISMIPSRAPYTPSFGL